MLRPSSLSLLLATVVAGTDGTNAFKPHTAILALPESAEVYAFSSTYARPSAVAAAEASGSRNHHAISSSSSIASHDAPGIAALLKGLMVDHNIPSTSLTEAESPLDTLEGEERIHALAAVGTIAWREEMERIHAPNRYGRASRSASGSTAAGSGSGRGRARAGTKGRDRERHQGEYVTSPDSTGARTSSSAVEDGRSSATMRPKIALPGTSVVRALDHEQEEHEGVGLVPLLLDCELGPILVMPLVASAPQRKAGGKELRSATSMSPSTPPSPEGDHESPVSPSMLLILNCTPARVEGEENHLTVLIPPKVESSNNPDTPTGSLHLHRPPSPTSSLRRLLRRTSSQQTSALTPESSEALTTSGELPTPKGTKPPFSFGVQTESDPSAAPPQHLSEKLNETQLWISLYASAKAVARVITPALVACGPTLRALSGTSGM
ncbi:hypothetical protein K437DRAFT_256308 [Tilletiaria anomala UBC 951]|uniref:Uncharacterized protein n=1 Tax=Tilletiaria anomala (strain ATCC 24038 / CBS 436.72 / UBC 951) TaxID=1037660 RepID=A0A066W4X1_TILAU|nr:uncharacterized protein K437DRAFT_256308 [Tilletiaria anomala UBC 951]KDN46129.1 hypothetical protein K437DRAFT_256308 [Tilletiaria anomala UBC 951]